MTICVAAARDDGFEIFENVCGGAAELERGFRRDRLEFAVPRTPSVPKIFLGPLMIILGRCGLIRRSTLAGPTPTSCHGGWHGHFHSAPESFLRLDTRHVHRTRGSGRRGRKFGRAADGHHDRVRGDVKITTSSAAETISTGTLMNVIALEPAGPDDMSTPDGADSSRI